MSNTQPHRRHSKLIDDDVGEVDVNRAGGWSRQEVEKMDAAFCTALRQVHPEAEVGKENKRHCSHDQRKRIAATRPA